MSLVLLVIKVGIIMGVGIVVVILVFEVGGCFESFLWIIFIVIGIVFYLIFFKYFVVLKICNVFWGILGKLGIFLIIVLVIVLVLLFSEVFWLIIEWGFIMLDFVILWSEYIVFGLGLLLLEMFL